MAVSTAVPRVPIQVGKGTRVTVAVPPVVVPTSPPGPSEMATVQAAPSVGHAMTVPPAVWVWPAGRITVPFFRSCIAGRVSATGGGGRRRWGHWGHWGHWPRWGGHRHGERAAGLGRCPLIRHWVHLDREFAGFAPGGAPQGGSAGGHRLARWNRRRAGVQVRAARQVHLPHQGESAPGRGRRQCLRPPRPARP